MSDSEDSSAAPEDESEEGESAEDTEE